jgi:uracil-DNA glycosylase
LEKNMTGSALENFSIEASWDTILKEEYKKPYFSNLATFVAEERKNFGRIYPPKGLVFRALQLTPFEKVKVVIVGQDPYHGPGQAHGLCFSVPRGVPPPPSLQNIFKELHDDLKMTIPSHGSLEKWAKEGVLLLNATLTVREGEPLSHHKKGWEEFTDSIIRALALRQAPVIFLLWGRNAIDKCRNVKELSEQHQHCILTASHPSPLSAYNGFFGCHHFSKANELLKKQGISPIDWQLE